MWCSRGFFVCHVTSARILKWRVTFSKFCLYCCKCGVNLIADFNASLMIYFIQLCVSQPPDAFKELANCIYEIAHETETSFERECANESFTFWTLFPCQIPCWGALSRWYFGLCVNSDSSIWTIQIETKTKDALSHKISFYQKCHRLQTNDGH